MLICEEKESVPKYPDKVVNEVHKVNVDLDYNVPYV